MVRGVAKLEAASGPDARLRRRIEALRIAVRNAEGLSGGRSGVSLVILLCRVFVEPIGRIARLQLPPPAPAPPRSRRSSAERSL
ncbi:MAG TPA: hypothetical protein VIM21_00055, partial [Gemmatimonadaceae bacterium]